MFHVTTSMLKSYKNCRRRFWFEYVEQIKPVTAQQPLRFGSLVHAGLEALLAGHDYVEAISTLAAEGEAECEIPPEQTLDPDIARIAVQAYDRHVDWRNWNVQAVEQEFCEPVGHGIRLVGKIDAIGSVNGTAVLIEHKTASTVNESYFHNKLWDDQATNYLAAAQSLGLDVCGIMYDVIEKCGLKRKLATPFANRRYKKDGGLAANCREHDETDQEYLDRIRQWYDEPTRFQQRVITRNQAQIDEARADLVAAVKDMKLSAKHDRYYRNPQACSIYGCPYQSVCLEYTPEVIDVTFSRKTKQSEEISIDW